MQDDASSKYRVVPLEIRGSGHLPTRSLSQLITSFIASEAKGIRHVPLLTFVLPITYGRYILSAFNFTFLVTSCQEQFGDFNYKNNNQNRWRITDSEPLTPACKAGALCELIPFL